MSKKLYEESNVQEIASAIREKNEVATGTPSSETYRVRDMASAIRSLPVINPSDYRTAAAQDEIDNAQNTNIDQIGLEVTGLTNAINTLQPSATAADIGKAIIVKTVADGKPSTYEYGEAGGGGGDTSNCAPVIINTASGNVASFDDGAEDMPVKKMVVNINAVQEGSGAPSSENVRPFSPWTNCTVKQFGLPRGYRAVDYVQVKNVISIDTDIDFNATDLEISSVFRSITYKQYGAIYSNYVNEQTNATRLIYYVNSNSLIVNNATLAGGGGTAISAVSGFNTLVSTHKYLVLNGTEITARTNRGNATTNKKFSVGAASAATNIRGLVIKKSGNVQLVLIPCVNEDGIAGFYESQSGTFHTTTNPNDVVAYGNYAPNDLLANITDIAFIDSTTGDQLSVRAGTLVINEDGSAELRARPYYANYNGETLVGPWLSSQDVFVEGATPTTGAQVIDLGGVETLYQIGAVQIRTNYGTNYIWANCGNVRAEYPADTKLYVDNQTRMTRSLIAGIEAGMTATKSYSAGDLLIVGDDLYKVATTITSGATLTPGTNVTKTTVAEQLIMLAQS